ncbi:MAG: methylated-DNA--[protein]-cysteine S-methyltransferase [Bacillota bacterium]|nr:methylated-DNA--[protein]-cysteine S-methyltransferase [Bacillota bacterium]
MHYSYIYDTPVGKITLQADNKALTALLFGEYSIKEGINEENKILNQAYIELWEYFNGARKDFSVPLEFSGTPFYEKVWKALKNIPYGQTLGYKDLAFMIDSPKASRAVGRANNKNPLPIFLPCHRVIGHDGQLVGYGGGLFIKKFLLDLEKSNM